MIPTSCKKNRDKKEKNRYKKYKQKIKIDAKN